jgi:orotate phosphoribosyltransferase
MISLAQKINNCARLEGVFTLRSGKTSTVYFDKYQFQSDPVLLDEIVMAMASLVPKDTQVLAGLEMGGIPLVTLLGQKLQLPVAFIRKEAKTYGTCKYAEGADLKGRRVCLIEDVVSSGGALLDALDKLQKDGVHVKNAICVIDRESGGKEALAERGFLLESLLLKSDLEKNQE